MKTAARVLGIVGGALAIIICIWTIAGIAIADGFVNQSNIINEAINEAQESIQDQDIPELDSLPSALPNLITGSYNLGIGLAITFGILGLIGGVLGLIGGILVPKNNVLAGVFMLVGGVLTFSGCITFILLVLGGIFALVKGKEPLVPANP
jgi:hypothetical protein